MTSLSSYRELIVWQKSMDLTVRIYALTRCFPAAERYGITSQMRRSASSIFEWIVISGEWRVVSGELCDRVTHYDILKLVSGIDRLAEVNGLDGKDLRAYAVLSRRGEIWDYITDATVGVLHSSEHRGGAGTALDRGVCSVAWCCAGLSSGTGNLPDIVNKAGNDNARAMQVLVERLIAESLDHGARLTTLQCSTLETLIKSLSTPTLHCLLNDCADSALTH